ncbi:hypothetical protein MP228_004206 [Amoeboaphelidium protococcarum]|nr:hypothetical protein MP228_004206 [Amoeboaphelidium protococcarum]
MSENEDFFSLPSDSQESPQDMNGNTDEQIAQSRSVELQLQQEEELHGDDQEFEDSDKDDNQIQQDSDTGSDNQSRPATPPRFSAVMVQSQEKAVDDDLGTFSFSFAPPAATRQAFAMPPVAIPTLDSPWSTQGDDDDDQQDAKQIGNTDFNAQSVDQNFSDQQQFDSFKIEPPSKLAQSVQQSDASDGFDQFDQRAFGAPSKVVDNEQTIEQQKDITVHSDINNVQIVEQTQEQEPQSIGEYLSKIAQSHNIDLQNVRQQLQHLEYNTNSKAGKPLISPFKWKDSAIRKLAFASLNIPTNIDDEITLIEIEEEAEIVQRLQALRRRSVSQNTSPNATMLSQQLSIDYFQQQQYQQQHLRRGSSKSLQNIALVLQDSDLLYGDSQLAEDTFKMKVKNSDEAFGDVDLPIIDQVRLTYLSTLNENVLDTMEDDQLVNLRDELLQYLGDSSTVLRYLEVGKSNIKTQIKENNKTIESLITEMKTASSTSTSASRPESPLKNLFNTSRS